MIPTVISQFTNLSTGGFATAFILKMPLFNYYYLNIFFL